MVVSRSLSLVESLNWKQNGKYCSPPHIGFNSVTKQRVLSLTWSCQSNQTAISLPAAAPEASKHKWLHQPGTGNYRSMSGYSMVLFRSFTFHLVVTEDLNTSHTTTK